MNELKWGIISTGAIAHTFAKGVRKSQTGMLAAVGSRDQKKAEIFGEEYGIPNRYGSYEELLADESVQAVYIATPHPQHLEWVVKAAEAGKHILCEKPLTMNAAEAMVALEATRANDVFLMEAFMYRCHPQTARVAELIQSGEIGQVKYIQASFSFRAGYDENSRIWNNALGGGGILDVGGYTSSMVRVLAGAAQGKPFAEPTDMQVMGNLAPTGVDEFSVAQLRFSDNLLAQICCGVGLSAENKVRVFGTEGQITIPLPWISSTEGEPTTIHIESGGKAREETIEAGGPLYALEADAVARNIEARQSPQMSRDDTLGNMKTLDLWRSKIGLVYDSEKLEAQARPLMGRALRNPSAEKNTMKYGKIAGVEKPIARLVMGAMSQNIVNSMAVFDDYYERGGNAFDTSFHYGDSDKILGHWMSSRGVQNEIVVIAKGAHTPDCNPEALSSQLLKSLENLQLETADLYCMHRDNPEIPASEFVDVLNEHFNAGRIKAFGGSNWSLARVEEANAYARQKGLQGFSLLSNNFSLARMVNPVWDGCVACSDADSKRWLEEHQMTVLSWSSQARGFFVRGDRDFTADAELTNSWYSDDNFERLARVNQLSRERDISPLNIAAAFVLHQKFPIFALIGPQTIEETRTAMPALEVSLSDAEMKWLNLESDSRDA